MHLQYGAAIQDFCIRYWSQLSSISLRQVFRKKKPHSEIRSGTMKV